MGGVWVQREGCIGGVSRCGWGAEGLWVRREGCVWGRIEVWLGVAWERLGCGCGCGWGSPGSFWGLDGTEVLCFRRWEEV